MDPPSRFRTDDLIEDHAALAAIEPVAEDNHAQLRMPHKPCGEGAGRIPLVSATVSQELKGAARHASVNHLILNGRLPGGANAELNQTIRLRTRDKDYVGKSLSIELGRGIKRPLPAC
jgi:hypothetical protein